jgi:hypothetical protein
VRRHAEASFADPTRRRAIGLGRFTVVCLAIVGLVAFLGIGAPTASAIDTCPNVVFRTGPSAKLPECRAYELVSPTFSGGKPPTFESFLGDLPGMFATDTVTPQGDSVVYNTFGGALSGFSGTGYVDRYRARRTADGWETESVSPGGDERNSGIGDGPGGVSPDHEYAAEAAVEPTAKLFGPAFAAYAGVPFIEILRTPDGYEPLAQGSLGVDAGGESEVRADWITPKATHVIFGAEKKLEPQAVEVVASQFLGNVYDRSPGGPTHVVSLLPDGTSAPEGSRFLGTTKDGTEVAFLARPTNDQQNGIYVRRDNLATQNVVTANGVLVGKKLECEAGGSEAYAPEGTFSYQWLRNGIPTGDTTDTYTATSADEGAAVQCLETNSGAEGTSIAASETRFVDGYQGKTFPPPNISEVSTEPRGIDAALDTVGSPLTCSAPGHTISGLTIAYQWFSEGTAIGGATSATYTPVEGDIGSSLQCRMTFTNTSGTSVAYSNPRAIYRPAPKASANPAITNETSPGDLTPAAGDELACSSGTWSGTPSFAYQWLRGGEEIASATSATYTTAAADEGETVQCRVSATDSGGTTQAVSEAVTVDPQPTTSAPRQTSPGRIFGGTSEFSSASPVGQTLFCGAGEWEGSPSFTYQWLKNGTVIGSATSSTYTPTAADVGAVVQCRLTATNEGGATVAIEANEGAKVVIRYLHHGPPHVAPGLLHLDFNNVSDFDGIFNGRVFYSDAPRAGGGDYGGFGNLYMYDLDEEKTTSIESHGDASIINVSEDGSHVYFVSTSALTGAEQNQYGNAAVPPAKGTGTLTAGSKEVTGVNTSEGNFRPGMAITGPGIPAPEQGELIDLKTTITAVGQGTLTLSQEATASGPAALSASAPNLYVWTAEDESTKFIATAAPKDVESDGENKSAGLNTWATAIATTEAFFDKGRAISHTRSTPDGSVFAFESTGQLTDFDNTEADAADCGKVGRTGLPVPGEGCDEVYRYDATNGELICVSCGPGSGPATGEARLQSINENGGTEGVAPATPNSPVENLTADGRMVFFESTEGLVPEDGNKTNDVYRWRQGAGQALISTGQDVGESALYGVTPDGSDVIFGTRETLLPQDLNGTTVRLYDARIGGGFPPPDETVTEPCAGDICQGQGAAAPQPPNLASSSLNGEGEAKPKLRCSRSSRRVVRKGNERCVHRKHHKRKRAHHKRRAAR